MTYRESKFASYSSSFEHKSSASTVLTNQQTTPNDNHCARCSYSIYPLELMGSIMGKKYHRTCFKCCVCDRQLDLKTFQTNQVDLTDTQIYCSSHAPRNGKGTITFNSTSQSNSPSLQHRPYLNKSKSQDNLDSKNGSRISPISNDQNKTKSKDDLRTTDDDNTAVITIPVIIKTEAPKSATSGKLNEMGTKLLELSKSNVDLRIPDEDDDVVVFTSHKDDRKHSKTETTKPIVTFVTDSVTPISIVSDNKSVSPTNENTLKQTYSPTTVRELYLYDHEIDQLIKDLESNKQPHQFLNFDSNNQQSSNVLVDSVLDKGVVVDRVPTIGEVTSTTSQGSYSSHMREQTSSIRVESNATSHTSSASHSESYHLANNNISNKIQYFIEQNASKQADYNRQSSTASVQSKPDRQSSIGSSDETEKKYISVLIPSIKEPPYKINPNEVHFIKSDSNTPTNSNGKYIEVIHSSPQPHDYKPPLNHSQSIDNQISPSTITVKPVPIISPENVILGDNQNLGAIKLTVYYDELRHRLSVTIHQAQNLKNLEKNKKAVSDPYCRIYLLPDDKQRTLKRKTKVVKNNLNPKWEETFDYPMTFEVAESKDLIVNMKDERGLFQKAEDCFMGEVLLRLKSIDIKKQYTRWIYLQPMNAVSKLLLSSGIRPYS